MPFLPIFSVIYELIVFLIIWPYLLAFILPSNSIIGPIPCQEKHPHVVKESLPICTLGLVHLIECCSPFMRLTYTLPLLCTLSNLLSSEKSTFIQSSTVKCSYFLVHSIRRRLLRKLINGFFRADQTNNFPLLSLLLTILEDTDKQYCLSKKDLMKVAVLICPFFLNLQITQSILLLFFLGLPFRCCTVTVCSSLHPVVDIG